MHVAGSKHSLSDPNAQDMLSFDMNFTSAIITQDEYTVSKTVPSVSAKEARGKLTGKNVNCEIKPVKKPAAKKEIRPKKSDECLNATERDGDLNVSEDISSGSQSDNTRKGKTKLREGKESSSGANGLKSSLKTSDSKKAVCSVTWADAKTDFDGQNLEEFRELEGEKAAIVIPTPHPTVEEVSGEDSYRLSSAEACAEALSLAAEAVASGEYDASDAGMEFTLNLYLLTYDSTVS